MAKILQSFVKYTKKELDQYVANESSCVRKVNSDMHLQMRPYQMNDFKHALQAHIIRTKVGYYDLHLKGIVLDIKNIKVLGTSAALRSDDCAIHINLNADFYVFCPESGVVLSGIVKHISKSHVGAIIYRVFNASIRFTNKVEKDEIVMNQEIKFRIKYFDLQNVFPYIEGEILLPDTKIKLKNKSVIKNNIQNEVDSGIEEKDENREELDELIDLIKQEPQSDIETEVPIKKRKNGKRKSSENLGDFEVIANAKLKKPKKEKKPKLIQLTADSIKQEESDD